VRSAKLQPPDASVENYRCIQKRMGTTRAVIVTPSTYGTNNAAMLHGLASFGAHARGVAVISGKESDDDLREMHRQGVRGVRINLSLGVTHDASVIERMADRIQPLGWHLQLLMSLEQLLTLEDVLHKLPVDVVFDHFARVTPRDGGVHPAHDLVKALLIAQRAWVKISGGYLLSDNGSITAPELIELARSYTRIAPERVVWGSDWPHATASAGYQPMPDDAQQIDHLAAWMATPQLLEQILVTNPARLYEFHT
jgi:predicted TIM-barrel fold metal-dependent hydrolase